MFCCMLLYVHSSIAIILMGKRELQLVALFNLSSWCLVMIEWLFLAKPWVWYSIVSFFLYCNTPSRGLYKSVWKQVRIKDDSVKKSAHDVKNRLKQFVLS